MQRLNGRPSRLTHYIVARIWAMFEILNALKQRIRYLSYYPRFDTIGDGVILDNDIYINRPQSISLGDRVFVGQSCYLNAIDDIEIGDYTLIAAECHLMTWNHRIHNRAINLRDNGRESRPITIGDGVWLGYNAIVLPGVTIGDGAVVGAGAVVTDDVDPFDVVGGVPAEPIGRRTEDGVEKYADITETDSD